MCDSCRLAPSQPNVLKDARTKLNSKFPFSHERKATILDCLGTPIPHNQGSRTPLIALIQLRARCHLSMLIRDLKSNIKSANTYHLFSQMKSAGWNVLFK